MNNQPTYLLLTLPHRRSFSRASRNRRDVYSSPACGVPVSHPYLGERRVANQNRRMSAEERSRLPRWFERYRLIHADSSSSADAASRNSQSAGIQRSLEKMPSQSTTSEASAWL